MVLIAGSANLDFVVRAAHIPAPGETVLGRAFETFPGGKGANQAVACARAGGAATAMLLALGDDAFAMPLIDSLTQAQVQLHIVRTGASMGGDADSGVAGIPTGTAFICVSDDGENAITVAPGANFCLAPEHLPSLQGVSHLLMQLEIPLPTVLAYARAAKAHGVQVVLNAAPAPAQALPAELLALVDILVVNEGELAAIAATLPEPVQPANMACDPLPPTSPPTQHYAIEAQLEALHMPCVVVTLGRKGCMALLDNKVRIEQAAYAVDVVDTTGAGDTFCGTLVAALSQGQAMADALRMASAAAALACTKMGAQTSIPEHSAVKRFMLVA